ncbi:MAG: iron ABC transporter permease [Burkholderiaceae bacterium]|jgi:iron complex transport system permease protein|nr:iron ABC transporter permease [Burkholderiaceae bacterium]MEB2317417.1 iron ABC transporter permease [Pseudomonadota bacterium]
MHRAPRLAWPLIALAALLGFGLAGACGSGGCAPAMWWWWADGADPLARELVLGLRLPRAAAGFAVGGLLALAGALLQVLLRNPLADPWVLGVSGGGALGAVLAMWAGAGAALVTGAAWIGAAVSTLLLFAVGAGGAPRGPAHGAVAPLRILLTGVMLASGWGALLTLVLSLAPDARLRGMLFWLIGDLAGADGWLAPALALAAGLAVAMRLAPALNLMLLGDARAFSLGVDVARLRLATCLLAALAAGFAVTTAGAIGFVGLIVPHSLRLVLGNDQRGLLPACVIAGGSLVVVADTLARTVVAPIQLPVGAIVSLVGVPVFLGLLVRSRALR